MVTEYKVVGMSCGHCVGSVTGEVSKIDGVRHVDVDLATGTVRVESASAIDDAVFAAAIDDAGFEVAA